MDVPTHRLLVNNVDVALIEVAAGRAQQRKGLLGRDGLHGGAMWFPKVKSVHTVRMRFPIDVAFVDSTGTVCKVTMMKPGRVGAWVRRSKAVLEAEAGMFASWNLKVGAAVAIVSVGSPHAG